MEASVLEPGRRPRVLQLRARSYRRCHGHREQRSGSDPDLPDLQTGFFWMYSTCLFCNHGLGSNEAIEAFPVGRRLAFDQQRGRLWVVCRHCEKWNLTPLEERWDAIESCERRFRDTRKRVSTDNIGLARLSEGLELV